MTNLKDDFYQDKISRFDYREADKIVDAILELFHTHFPPQDDITNNITIMELQEEIMDFMLENVLERAAGKHAKTIRSLIPANPKKLQKVKDSGGTFMYRYPDIKKSLSWLEDNGMCLDNLRLGPSTIPDAGRGAFATRSIKQGETITVTPMLHIANQSLMDMFRIVETTGTGENGGSHLPIKEYDRSKPMGQQLLVNYCFGHAESSLLLFPMGSLVTLINHYRPIDLEGESSTTAKSDLQPNAFLTWRRGTSLTNAHEWHDMGVNELAEMNRIGLVMSVEALQDINAGDE